MLKNDLLEKIYRGKIGAFDGPVGENFFQIVTLVKLQTLSIFSSLITSNANFLVYNAALAISEV